MLHDPLDVLCDGRTFISSSSVLTKVNPTIGKSTTSLWSSLIQTSLFSKGLCSQLCWLLEPPCGNMYEGMENTRDTNSRAACVGPMPFWELPLCLTSICSWKVSSLSNWSRSWALSSSFTDAAADAAASWHPCDGRRCSAVLDSNFGAQIGMKEWTVAQMKHKKIIVDTALIMKCNVALGNTSWCDTYLWCFLLFCWYLWGVSDPDCDLINQVLLSKSI